MNSRNEAKSPGLSTFAGVFTPSMLTIFGVVLFMRSTFVIGEGGILSALIILFVAEIIIFFTALSICAISSNMKIRGGGAYFIISRVLGPNFGGTIGLALYVAQALTVVFAVVGFTEALFSTFSSIPSVFFLPIALVTLYAVAVIVYVGSQWATKAQYIIMMILFVAIAFMLIGTASKFSVSRFKDNFSAPAVHTPLDKDTKTKEKMDQDRRKLERLVEDIRFESDLEAEYELTRFVRSLVRNNSYSFWVLFAIYFPAVTGILTGVNMSGDLKNPAKSIPRGTMIALGIGMAVYFVQIILCGGAFERTDLIERPFGILQSNAFLGFGFIVVAGMFSSSLSSGIGDLMGSPRVLQAVARDRIMPILYFFGKGSGNMDEPRRALGATLLIQTVVLVCVAGFGGAKSALDMIATVVAMFYLWTYGMINVAAFVETASHNPSFRPTFKYFHWSTALLGAIGCAIAAVMINFFAAIIATLIVLIVHGVLRRRMLESHFGNAMRGFFFERVRSNLIRLLRLPEDNRNWRPTIFVFIGNPQTWETLVTYAVWLDNACGIVRVGHVMLGDVSVISTDRRLRINQIEKFSREQDFTVFPMVSVAESVPQGLSILLQSESVRPIRPNLAMFGWGPSVREFISHVHWAVRDDLSFIAIKADELPDPEKVKRVDLWWHSHHASSLSLLMAHLLCQNWEWHHAKIRIIMPVKKDAKKTALADAATKLLEDARLEAEVLPVSMEEMDACMLHEYSGDADCIFINVDLPEDEEAGQWYSRLEEQIEGLPTTIMVHSTIKTDILI